MNYAKVKALKATKNEVKISKFKKGILTLKIKVFETRKEKQRAYTNSNQLTIFVVLSSLQVVQRSNVIFCYIGIGKYP